MSASMPPVANVVVTGVSSGIGFALASFLANRGYRVFGSVRKAADADKLTAALGDLFVPLVFDVCDKAAVRAGAAEVHQKIGDGYIGALVNNAGLALFGPMESLDDDAFEHIMQVNVLGARNVTNAFLPLMRSPAFDGVAARKIINISSLSGIINTPMNGAYCVSKHAMESLGEIYRRELMGTGIDVVAIRSGPIQSQIWKKNAARDTKYDGTIYENLANNAQKIMRGAEAGALPAEVIAQLVLDIIEGRKKRTAYEVSKGALMSRILSSTLMPKRLADRLINNALNKKT